MKIIINILRFNLKANKLENVAKKAGGERRRDIKTRRAHFSVS